MLSYRHSFHAGNHADVLKHLSLLALLRAVTRKPKPLCYFETHAGAGLYATRSPQARKTAEFDEGAGRLLAASCQDPLLQDYLALIRQPSPNGAMQHYPGSPWLAQSQLRPQDQLILCELHPEDAGLLRQNLGDKPQVHIHQRDGFAAIKALLPPAEKRGLVLIDPPYERKEDYQRCVSAVQELQRRFRAAVVALWYPRLPRNPAGTMLGALEKLPGVDLLNLSLDVAPELGDFGMFGSGMLIVQPPWGLEDTLVPALREAAGLLSPHADLKVRSMRQ